MESSSVELDDICRENEPLYSEDFNSDLTLALGITR